MQIDASAVLKLMPLVAIDWHPSTPRRFGCEPGCINCCLHQHFMPSEAYALPKRIMSRLVHVSYPGLSESFAPQQSNGIEGTCTFFDPKSIRHCTIFSQRPVRCRLFPFKPLLSKERITIVTFLKPYCKEEERKWFRCYGLGNGHDVSAAVEALSRRFLTMLCEECPIALEEYIVENVDSMIAPWVVEKYAHPEYPTWKEAYKYLQRTLLRAASKKRQRRTGYAITDHVEP